jgi:hypothetical protein
MKTAALVVTALLTPGSIASAQPFVSGDAARDLVSALDRSRLDAIATADPAQPGAFVAALKIQGGRLLVIHARHPSEAAIQQRLAAGQYRDVYLDLQGTPTREGTFFVQDAGGDGLSGTLSESSGVDVLYEDGQRQTIFNGDKITQHLTAAEYDAKLAAADVRYARLLTLLTTAVPETNEQSALH